MRCAISISPKTYLCVLGMLWVDIALGDNILKDSFEIDPFYADDFFSISNGDILGDFVVLPVSSGKIIDGGDKLGFGRKLADCSEEISVVGLASSTCGTSGCLNCSPCGSPPTSTFLTYTLFSSSGSLFAHYSCNDINYIPHYSSNMCYYNGTWLSTSAPTCLETTNDLYLQMQTLILSLQDRFAKYYITEGLSSLPSAEPDTSTSILVSPSIGITCQMYSSSSPTTTIAFNDTTSQFYTNSASSSPTEFTNYFSYIGWSLDGLENTIICPTLNGTASVMCPINPPHEIPFAYSNNNAGNLVATLNGIAYHMTCSESSDELTTMYSACIGGEWFPFFPAICTPSTSSSCSNTIYPDTDTCLMQNPIIMCPPDFTFIPDSATSMMAIIPRYLSSSAISRGEVSIRIETPASAFSDSLDVNTLTETFEFQRLCPASTSLMESGTLTSSSSSICDISSSVRLFHSLTDHFLSSSSSSTSSSSTAGIYSCSQFISSSSSTCLTTDSSYSAPVACPSGMGPASGPMWCHPVSLKYIGENMCVPYTSDCPLPDFGSSSISDLDVLINVSGDSTSYVPQVANSSSMFFFRAHLNSYLDLSDAYVDANNNSFDYFSSWLTYDLLLNSEDEDSTSKNEQLTSLGYGPFPLDPTLITPVTRVYRSQTSPYMNELTIFECNSLTQQWEKLPRKISACGGIRVGKGLSVTDDFLIFEYSSDGNTITYQCNSASSSSTSVCDIVTGFWSVAVIECSECTSGYTNWNGDGCAPHNISSTFQLSECPSQTVIVDSLSFWPLRIFNGVDEFSIYSVGAASVSVIVYDANTSTRVFQGSLDLLFKSQFMFFPSSDSHYYTMQFITNSYNSARNCTFFIYVLRDECSLPYGSSGRHKCDANYGICTNTDAGYTCACEDGYIGDGFTCSVPSSVSLTVSALETYIVPLTLSGVSIPSTSLGDGVNVSLGDAADYTSILSANVSQATILEMINTVNTLLTSYSSDASDSQMTDDSKTFVLNSTLTLLQSGARLSLDSMFLDSTAVTLTFESIFTSFSTYLEESTTYINNCNMTIKFSAQITDCLAEYTQFMSFALTSQNDRISTQYNRSQFASTVISSMSSLISVSSSVMDNAVNHAIAYQRFLSDRSNVIAIHNSLSSSSSAADGGDESPFESFVSSNLLDDSVRKINLIQPTLLVSDLELTSNLPKIFPFVRDDILTQLGQKLNKFILSINMIQGISNVLIAHQPVASSRRRLNVKEFDNIIPSVVSRVTQHNNVDQKYSTVHNLKINDNFGIENENQIIANHTSKVKSIYGNTLTSPQRRSLSNVTMNAYSSEKERSLYATSSSVASLSAALDGVSSSDLFVNSSALIPMTSTSSSSGNLTLVTISFKALGRVLFAKNGSSDRVSSSVSSIASSSDDSWGSSLVQRSIFEIIPLFKVLDADSLFKFYNVHPYSVILSLFYASQLSSSYSSVNPIGPFINITVAFMSDWYTNDHRITFDKIDQSDPVSSDLTTVTTLGTTSILLPTSSTNSGPGDASSQIRLGSSVVISSPHPSSLIAGSMMSRASLVPLSVLQSLTGDQSTTVVSEVNPSYLSSIFPLVFDKKSSENSKVSSFVDASLRLVDYDKSWSYSIPDRPSSVYTNQMIGDSDLCSVVQTVTASYSSNILPATGVPSIGRSISNVFIAQLCNHAALPSLSSFLSKESKSTSTTSPNLSAAVAGLSSGEQQIANDAARLSFLSDFSSSLPQRISKHFTDKELIQTLSSDWLKLPSTSAAAGERIVYDLLLSRYDMVGILNSIDFFTDAQMICASWDENRIIKGASLTGAMAVELNGSIANSYTYINSADVNSSYTHNKYPNITSFGAWSGSQCRRVQSNSKTIEYFNSSLSSSITLYSVDDLGSFNAMSMRDTDRLIVSCECALTGTFSIVTTDNLPLSFADILIDRVTPVFDPNQLLVLIVGLISVVICGFLIVISTTQDFRTSWWSSGKTFIRLIRFNDYVLKIPFKKELNISKEILSEWRLKDIKTGWLNLLAAQKKLDDDTVTEDAINISDDKDGVQSPSVYKVKNSPASSVNNNKKRSKTSKVAVGENINKSVLPINNADISTQNVKKTIFQNSGSANLLVPSAEVIGHPTNHVYNMNQNYIQSPKFYMENTSWNRNLPYVNNNYIPIPMQQQQQQISNNFISNNFVNNPNMAYSEMMLNNRQFMPSLPELSTAKNEMFYGMYRNIPLSSPDPRHNNINLNNHSSSPIHSNFDGSPSHQTLLPKKILVADSTHTSSYPQPKQFIPSNYQVDNFGSSQLNQHSFNRIPMNHAYAQQQYIFNQQQLFLQQQQHFNFHPNSQQLQQQLQQNLHLSSLPLGSANLIHDNNKNIDYQSRSFPEQPLLRDANEDPIDSTASKFLQPNQDDTVEQPSDGEMESKAHFLPPDPADVFDLVQGKNSVPPWWFRWKIRIRIFFHNLWMYISLQRTNSAVENARFIRAMWPYLVYIPNFGDSLETQRSGHESKRTASSASFCNLNSNSSPAQMQKKSSAPSRNHTSSSKSPNTVRRSSPAVSKRGLSNSSKQSKQKKNDKSKHIPNSSRGSGTSAKFTSPVSGVAIHLQNSRRAKATSNTASRPSSRNVSSERQAATNLDGNSSPVVDNEDDGNQSLILSSNDFEVLLEDRVDEQRWLFLSDMLSEASCLIAKRLMGGSVKDEGCLGVFLDAQTPTDIAEIYSGASLTYKWMRKGQIKELDRFRRNLASVENLSLSDGEEDQDENDKKSQQNEDVDAPIGVGKQFTNVHSNSDAPRVGDAELTKSNIDTNNINNNNFNNLSNMLSPLDNNKFNMLNITNNSSYQHRHSNVVHLQDSILHPSSNHHFPSNSGLRNSKVNTDLETPQLNREDNEESFFANFDTNQDYEQGDDMAHHEDFSGGIMPNMKDGFFPGHQRIQSNGNFENNLHSAFEMMYYSQNGGLNPGNGFYPGNNGSNIESLVKKKHSAIAGKVRTLADEIADNPEVYQSVLLSPSLISGSRSRASATKAQTSDNTRKKKSKNSSSSKNRNVPHLSPSSNSGDDLSASSKPYSSSQHNKEDNAQQPAPLEERRKLSSKSKIRSSSTPTMNSSSSSTNNNNNNNKIDSLLQPHGASDQSNSGDDSFHQTKNSAFSDSQNLNINNFSHQNDLKNPEKSSFSKKNRHQSSVSLNEGGIISNAISSQKNELISENQFRNNTNNTASSDDFQHEDDDRDMNDVVSIISSSYARGRMKTARSNASVRTKEAIKNAVVESLKSLSRRNSVAHTRNDDISGNSSKRDVESVKLSQKIHSNNSQFKNNILENESLQHGKNLVESKINGGHEHQPLYPDHYESVVPDGSIAFEPAAHPNYPVHTGIPSNEIANISANQMTIKNHIVSHIDSSSSAHYSSNYGVHSKEINPSSLSSNSQYSKNANHSSSQQKSVNNATLLQREFDGVSSEILFSRISRLKLILLSSRVLSILIHVRAARCIQRGWRRSALAKKATVIETMTTSKSNSQQLADLPIFQSMQQLQDQSQMKYETSTSMLVPLPPPPTQPQPSVQETPQETLLEFTSSPPPHIDSVLASRQYSHGHRSQNSYSLDSSSFSFAPSALIKTRNNINKNNNNNNNIVQPQHHQMQSNLMSAMEPTKSKTTLSPNQQQHQTMTPGIEPVQYGSGVLNSNRGFNGSHEFNPLSHLNNVAGAASNYNQMTLMMMQQQRLFQQQQYQMQQQQMLLQSQQQNSTIQQQQQQQNSLSGDSSNVVPIISNQENFASRLKQKLEELNSFNNRHQNLAPHRLNANTYSNNNNRYGTASNDPMHHNRKPPTVSSSLPSSTFPSLFDYESDEDAVAEKDQKIVKSVKSYFKQMKKRQIIQPESLDKGAKPKGGIKNSYFDNMLMQSSSSDDNEAVQNDGDKKPFSWSGDLFQQSKNLKPDLEQKSQLQNPQVFGGLPSGIPSSFQRHASFNHFPLPPLPIIHDDDVADEPLQFHGDEEEDEQGLNDDLIHPDLLNDDLNMVNGIEDLALLDDDIDLEMLKEVLDELKAFGGTDPKLLAELEALVERPPTCLLSSRHCDEMSLPSSTRYGGSQYYLNQNMSTRKLIMDGSDRASSMRSASTVRTSSRLHAVLSHKKKQKRNLMNSGGVGSMTSTLRRPAEHQREESFFNVEPFGMRAQGFDVESDFGMSVADPESRFYSNLVQYNRQKQNEKEHQELPQHIALPVILPFNSGVMQMASMAPGLPAVPLPPLDVINPPAHQSNMENYVHAQNYGAPAVMNDKKSQPGTISIAAAALERLVMRNKQISKGESPNKQLNTKNPGNNNDVVDIIDKEMENAISSSVVSIPNSKLSVSQNNNLTSLDSSSNNQNSSASDSPKVNHHTTLDPLFASILPQTHLVGNRSAAAFASAYVAHVADFVANQSGNANANVNPNITMDNNNNNANLMKSTTPSSLLHKRQSSSSQLTPSLLVHPVPPQQQEAPYPMIFSGDDLNNNSELIAFSPLASIGKYEPVSALNSSHSLLLLDINNKASRNSNGDLTPDVALDKALLPTLPKDQNPKISPADEKATASSTSPLTPPPVSPRLLLTDGSTNNNSIIDKYRSDQRTSRGISSTSPHGESAGNNTNIGATTLNSSLSSATLFLGLPLLNTVNPSTSTEQRIPPAILRLMRAPDHLIDVICNKFRFLDFSMWKIFFIKFGCASPIVTAFSTPPHTSTLLLVLESVCHLSVMILCLVGVMVTIPSNPVAYSASVGFVIFFVLVIFVYIILPIILKVIIYCFYPVEKEHIQLESNIRMRQSDSFIGASALPNEVQTHRIRTLNIVFFILVIGLSLISFLCFFFFFYLTRQMINDRIVSPLSFEPLQMAVTETSLALTSDLVAQRLYEPYLFLLEPDPLLPTISDEARSVEPTEMSDFLKYVHGGDQRPKLLAGLLVAALIFHFIVGPLLVAVFATFTIFITTRPSNLMFVNRVIIPFSEWLLMLFPQILDMDVIGGRFLEDIRERQLADLRLLDLAYFRDERHRLSIVLIHQMMILASSLGSSSSDVRSSLIDHPILSAHESLSRGFSNSGLNFDNKQTKASSPLGVTLRTEHGENNRTNTSIQAHTSTSLGASRKDLTISNPTSRINMLPTNKSSSNNDSQIDLLQMSSSKNNTLLELDPFGGGRIVSRQAVAAANNMFTPQQLDTSFQIQSNVIGNSQLINNRLPTGQLMALLAESGNASTYNGAGHFIEGIHNDIVRGGLIDSNNSLPLPTFDEVARKFEKSISRAEDLPFNRHEGPQPRLMSSFDKLIQQQFPKNSETNYIFTNEQNASNPSQQQRSSSNTNNNEDAKSAGKAQRETKLGPEDRASLLNAINASTAKRRRDNNHQK